MVSSTITSEPIAVVGAGCRFPGGSSSPSKLWELLRNPRDLVRGIERFSAEGFHNQDGHHHGTSNVKDAYCLEEDPTCFDAQFFNIQPNEAESIDPQQRILLETVYEGLEAAGQTIENLRGSSTAVFVGVMCDDYGNILYHDSEAVPTYAATGASRAILSNRVSYVFDWRGPSMTIDTACSSSLVAIHQAVQVLRDGTSKLAVAAGANLIFSPNMFIAESNLNMLSATGRSQMWDANANGYARGEGIGAVVLKTLKDALADGDHIECIIRETGLNQDGHTPGITMPSPEAQTRLILDTYRRAGLDPVRNKEDRCQYFEAHGTGTKAGDGVESRAIHDAFFSPSVDEQEVGPLWVGSIKTVIGHTEGTAGIAGVLRSMLAIQNNTIPPNMNFKVLNPEIESYYGNLQITTEARAWPEIVPGNVRRASVNSFGFGGANAHAIIEGYDPAYHASGIQAEVGTQVQPNLLPLVISASTEKSAATMTRELIAHMQQNPSIDVRSLAHTLYSGRSLFPFRAAFSGHNVEALIKSMEAGLKDTPATFARAGTLRDRRLLGVFTGQGAQWATMGRQLILSSPAAESVIDRLEAALASLPESDRPSWSLKEQMLVDADKSRIAEGAFSQPLCTALQVMVLELLKAAGISFKAVTGHSSGEIGAAYAAGFISAEDAIKIAYYRGVYAHMAQGAAGQRGGMLAVGTSFEDAHDLCNLPAFRGRIKVAAWNSSSSVTLSGDLDAIKHAKDVFDDESKFCRQLKVDTAYHSHHMNPCADAYRKALLACDIQILTPQDGARWYSSVHDGTLMGPAEELKSQYWVDNMVQPVLFAVAVEAAARGAGGFQVPTAVLEVGPHAALKGPASSAIEEALGADLPYFGTMARGQNDVAALAATLGNLWTAFGRQGANFRTFDEFALQQSTPKRLRNLPSYPWNHDRKFWYEARESREHRNRKDTTHTLLGVRIADVGYGELRWRNYLSSKEVPWLTGHKIQGQVLMPAAAFHTMAIESARLAAREMESELGTSSIRLVELTDAVVLKALAFAADRSIETLCSLSDIQVTKSDEGTVMSGQFRCDACPSATGGFIAMSHAKVRVVLNEPSATVLQSKRPDESRLIPVDPEIFYENLANIGYGYSGMFKGVTSLRRYRGVAIGEITSSWPEDQKDFPAEPYWMHPSALDVGFQTLFGAVSHPGDGTLWTLHIPTTIDRIVVNPAACLSRGGLDSKLGFTAKSFLSHGGAISGDIELRAGLDAEHPMVVVEGLAVSPVAPARPSDDRMMFAQTHFFPLLPTAELVYDAPSSRANKEDITERVSLFHLRQALAKGQKGAFQEWAQSIVDRTLAGTHPFTQTEWLSDTEDDIKTALALVKDAEVLAACARLENFAKTLESSASDNQAESLQNFYASAAGSAESRAHLARLGRQIAVRFPQIRILEINANSQSTDAILKGLENSFAAYTAIGLSKDEFEQVQEKYSDVSSRLIQGSFSLEEDLNDQGVALASYDLVIAANGLHATATFLSRVRELVRPGGFLLGLQVTNPEKLAVGLTVSALAQKSDICSPGLPFPSANDWDQFLQENRFSGLDTATPDDVYPFSVFVSQAVDSSIKAIRSPLSEANPKSIPHVVVIGGQQFATAKIVQEVRNLLTPFCKKITLAKSFEDVDSSTFDGKPMVLSLTELDAPFFRDLTGVPFRNMQTMFERCLQVVWIVSGSRDSNPYANVMKGVRRVLETEQHGLTSQVIDVGTRAKYSASTIVESLLRISIAASWDSSYSPLWEHERELDIAQDGSLEMNRYLRRPDLDLGYNTIRRNVSTQAVPLQDNVEIVSGGDDNDDQSLSVRCRRHHFVSPSSETEDHLSTVAVTHSVSRALRIGQRGFFYLSAGRHQESGKRVLVLSLKHGSLVKAPESELVPIDEDVDVASLLLSVASTLVVNSIVAEGGVGGSIVLHEAPEVLAKMALKLSEEVGFRTLLTTADPEKPSPYVFIHPHTGRRDAADMIPEDAQVYVACAHANSYGVQTFEQSLPFNVRKRTISDLWSARAVSYTTGDSDALAQTLEKAVSTAVRHTDGLDAVKHTVAIQELTQLKSSPSIAIVDWTSQAPVEAQVMSAMDEVTFHPNRTYFLVGMAGSLGLSTMMYMISRGARYFAIASRNPKIDSKWLADTEAAHGATIRLFAMDVTSKEVVSGVVDQIKATMPPIAGVADAALVMRDQVFTEISVENMNAALGPKVDGALILDELFSKADLDFFVLYSSLVYVTGNEGQGAYCAGNGFLVTLAHARRARGLTASVINLSGISGIGFIARTEHSLLNRLELEGYGTISELDYLYVFAEGVMAGRVESGRNPEVSGSLRVVDPVSDKNIPKWVTDPRFSHFILTNDSGNSSARGGADGDVPLKVSLLEAKTTKDAADIIQTALLAMLHKALSLPADEKISENAAIVELGVDSLFAVRMRQWFTQELDVSIPVIKILGGATAADIVQDVVDEMSPDLTPNIAVEGAAAAATEGESADAGSNVEEGASDAAWSLVDTLESSATSVQADEDSTSLVKRSTRPRPKFVRKVPMAIAASRFWFLRQYLGDETSFNVVFRVRITGNVDIDKIGHIFETISQRHEVLRTCFYFDEELNMPVQGVMAEHRFKMERKAVKGEAEVEAYTAEMVKYQFDLEQGELMRVAWLESSPDEGVMIVACHHIAHDGFSTNVLLSELDLMYRGEELPQIQKQFTDYAVQQRREIAEGHMAKELKYWKSVYPTLPDALPLFPLAGVQARQALTNYSHNSASITLDKATTAKIRAGVRSNRATTFHFMLAAYRVFLSRFLHTDDLAIGMADANREDVKVMNTIGFLLNLLPLRFRKVEGSTDFTNVLQIARDTARSALEHSRVPFDVLLEKLGVPRSAQHSPLFQAFIDYKVYSVEAPPMLNAKAESKSFDGATGYDIVLDVKDIPGSNLEIGLRTQKTMYPEHADIMLRSFVHLVRTFANDFEADTTQVPLFAESNKASTARLGRGVTVPRTWPETISRRIDESIAEYPNDIALRDGLGAELTYKEMQTRVAAIDASLRSSGVVPGDRIAVFQQPSAGFICSVLAIWRAGAVYMPLDPKRGIPALASMVASASPKTILVSNDTSANAGQLKSAAAVLNVDKLETVAGSVDLVNLSEGKKTASILFTSGSTGEPKGIVLPHSGMVNLLEGYSKTWPLGRPTVLQHTTYSFDLALDQIITAFGLGGTLYVASAEERLDSSLLAAAIAKNNISYTWATPTEYVSWINHGRDSLAAAKAWEWALIGGEAWDDSLRQAYAGLHLPKLRLQNSYGPTEASIVSAKHEVPINEPSAILPAGKAVPNTTLYIVDEQMRPLPAGVYGEVLIGGGGVAAGYLNAPELTARHFIEDKYAPADYVSNGWTKAYRTSDLGYLRPDGSLVFVGRIAGDTQVKLRGIRVQLEGIEAQIRNAAPGSISRAVASVRGTGPQQILVAFVEFRAHIPKSERAEFLATLLPRLPLAPSVTPSLLIEVDSIPHNSHGKVDRKAVNALALPANASIFQDGESLSETEKTLRNIWVSLLPGDVAGAVTIGRTTDLFAVGGHSLMIVQLQQRIRTELGILLKLVDLLEQSTLADLANLVDRTTSERVDWDEETALDLEAPKSSSLVETAPAGGRSVLLTGAAGFIGGHVLDQLIERPDVSRIHCVAVRPRAADHAKRQKLASLAARSEKVQLYSGDFTQPFFGLSEHDYQTLAAEVDTIVHSGASRSFFDSYSLLRGDNVSSTRQVIRLATAAQAQHGRRVAVHFLSSGERELASAPGDGSAGYVASKWVSERLLEKAAAQGQLSVGIYRMRSAPNVQGTQEEKSLYKEMSDLVRSLRAVPRGDTFTGEWDLMPVARIAKTVIEGALDVTRSQGVQQTPLEATVRMDMASAVKYLDANKDETSSYEKVPGHEWFGLAKLAGLSYQVTSQDIAVLDAQGREVGVVRR